MFKTASFETTPASQPGWEPAAARHGDFVVVQRRLLFVGVVTLSIARVDLVGISAAGCDVSQAAEQSEVKESEPIRGREIV